MGLKIGLSLKRFLFVSLILTQIASGQKLTEDDPQLKGIDIEENLGGRLPLSLQFMDEKGETVSLEKFFDNKTPVVFNLVYYECPMLCTYVLNGLVKGLSEVALKPGQDYKLVSLSINPDETWELARDKKAVYLPGLESITDSSAWTFLVGNDINIKDVADSLGFRYYYDEKQEEYAHAAATFILTGDGRISRYLYGLEYKSLDLRLSLLEASEGRIGTTMDRLILYCFGYDASSGGYVLIATQIMKLGGLITLLILAVFLAVLWKRDRKRNTN